jgi:hypothetical protein
MRDAKLTFRKLKKPLRMQAPVLQDFDPAKLITLQTLYDREHFELV